MSDPKNQRADGCSVTFSLIVATLLVLAFFFLRQCVDFDEEAPAPDHKTEEERRAKAAAHRSEEGNYTAAIDAYHAENDSSLEQVLEATVEKYAPEQTDEPEPEAEVEPEPAPEGEVAPESNSTDADDSAQPEEGGNE